MRAYDLRTGRLLPNPVVDPHEADEQMRGQPISRATSPGGRWAYTLYDGNGKTPFVHALDTSRATARCIDLDALGGENYLWGLRLTVGGDGRRLVVRNGLAPELVVDTKTFAVSKAPEPSPAPVAARQGSSLTWPWAAGAGAIALALTVAGLVAATRRHRHPALGWRPGLRGRT